MRMSETLVVSKQAKSQWVDDNIRRLSTVIRLEEKMVKECSLNDAERVRIKTRIALHENELSRFNDMKKEEPQDELSD